MTLNTTPFSHRIMKSLWEKGQFPMLSPSLPACRTEQSINVGRAVPSAHLTGTATASIKHTLSATEIATFVKFLLVMSSSCSKNLWSNISVICDTASAAAAPGS